MKIKSLLICACVGAAGYSQQRNKDYEYEKTFVDFVTSKHSAMQAQQ